MPDFEKKVRSRTTAPNGNGEAEFEEDPMTSREAIELMHNYFRVRDEDVRKRLSQFVKTLARAQDAR